MSQNKTLVSVVNLVNRWNMERVRREEPLMFEDYVREVAAVERPDTGQPCPAQALLRLVQLETIREREDVVPEAFGEPTAEFLTLVLDSDWSCMLAPLEAEEAEHDRRHQEKLRALFNLDPLDWMDRTRQSGD